MMNRKRPISPEDKELFRRAVEDTKPINQGKHKISKRSPKLPYSERRTAAEQQRPTNLPFSSESLAPEDWLSPEDTLHFARSGLQHKLLQRLQRGQIQLEATIDLHRQTVEEAIQTVSQFIDTCLEKNVRWICIIHGKGHLSRTGKPVLKSFLNQWLRMQPDVLAFHSAKPRQGGTGAVYVLLRGNHALMGEVLRN